MSAPQTSAAASSEGRVRLAALDDIANPGTLRVDEGGRRIALVRIDDTVYALGDRCSHAEASLAEGEIEVDDLEIECPRHGAMFDLETGEAATLPATQPVPTYRVEIEEGHVWLIEEQES